VSRYRLLAALPAFAVLAGCSTLPDITGAFGGKPRPEAAIAEARPQPVRRIAPRPAPVEEVAALDTPEPDQGDIADPSSDDEAPVVIRKIRPNAEPDLAVADEAPAAQPSGPMRLNVAVARDQINAYRSEQGLPALVIDTALMKAAKTQSDAMAKSDAMTHEVGGSFAARMKKVGIEDVPAGENIAAGYSSVSAVLRGWKASPAHDANLKLEDATRLGIAATPSPDNPGKLFWTLIVAGT
jgi:uncharacterized protein YkwD